MDEKRNNRTVERRLKESLKHDRARIQVGHISHFGLLEMSRQRIRSSVLESSTEKCPVCGGTGHMRSVSSVSLQLLRALEEMLLKGATHNMIVRTRTDIALYLLNQKRSHLRALEERFQIAIVINADASIGGQVSYVIEKAELVHTPEQAKTIAAQSVNTTPVVPDDEDDDIVEADDEDDEQEEDTAAGEFMPEAENEDEGVAAMPGTPSADDRPAEGDGHRRRRRRRGRRGESREGAEASPGAAAEHPAGDASENENGAAEAQASDTGDDSAGRPETNGESRGDAEHRRRRRGRRGGRRNRRDRDGETPQAASDQPGGDAASGFEAGSDAGADAGADAGTHAENHAEPTPAQRDVEAWRQPEAFRAHEPVEQPATVAPARESPQEPAAPAQTEAVEHAPAPTRRRSTVREPAPANFSGQPSVIPAPAYVVPTAEPPQPAVSEASATEDTTRPRRAGWWSRRVLGKE
jgi:ribonuclease E